MSGSIDRVEINKLRQKEERKLKEYEKQNNSKQAVLMVIQNP